MSKHKEALAKASEGIAPKIAKIKEELSCQLNDVEWQNRARELADAQEHYEREEQRKKDVMKQLNADLAVAKGKVSKLANVVATKREQREVVVEVKYDYELGTVTKTRTDTNEVISEREITDQERQSELELHDANDVIEGARAEEDFEDDDDMEAELGEEDVDDEDTENQ